MVFNTLRCDPEDFRNLGVRHAVAPSQVHCEAATLRELRERGTDQGLLFVGDHAVIHAERHNVQLVDSIVRVVVCPATLDGIAPPQVQRTISKRTKEVASKCTGHRPRVRQARHTVSRALTGPT